MKIKFCDTSYEVVGHVPLSAARNERGVRAPNASLEERFSRGLLPFKLRRASTEAEEQGQAQAQAQAPGKRNRPPAPSVRHAAAVNAQGFHGANRKPPVSSTRKKRPAEQAELLVLVSDNICQGNRDAESVAVPLHADEAEQMKEYIAEVVSKTARYTDKISEADTLLAAAYMKRLPKEAWKMPRKDLITACVMLAHKYLHDAQFRGPLWASFTGIPKEKLMESELKVLKQLGYDARGNPEPARWEAILMEERRRALAAHFGMTLVSDMVRSE